MAASFFRQPRNGCINEVLTAKTLIPSPRDHVQGLGGYGRRPIGMIGHSKSTTLPETGKHGACCALGGSSFVTITIKTASSSQADLLARPRHGEHDPITAVRHRWATKIKKQAWETHRKDLLEGRAPFDSKKMRRYVRLAQQDLTRPKLLIYYSRKREE